MSSYPNPDNSTGPRSGSAKRTVLYAVGGVIALVLVVVLLHLLGVVGG